MSHLSIRPRPAALALAAATALVLTGAALSGSSATPRAHDSAAPAAAVAGPADVVTAAGPAEAAPGVTVTASRTDLDDTDGRLDLSSVRHRLVQVSAQRVRVSYVLRTFGGFRDGLLASPDRDLVIELHRTTTRGADRNITVSSADGSLVATVISNATRKPIATAQVTRLDRRTIRISGSRALLGARSYFVTSNFHDGGSARCGWNGGWPVTCQDSVPDDGWIRVDPIGWPTTSQTS